MMTRTQVKNKLIRGRNGRTRFPGICAMARLLQVNRNHLYFVCTGARRSPRIEKSSWFKAVAGGRRS